MRLTDASVAIHPRTAWEAIDLGVLLAREHRGLLTLSWAAVTVPIFTLLSLLLWDYPTAVFLLFWWLKPVYERLPLIILSTAVFNPAPSLVEALRQWARTLRPYLLASLTWRRLSLTRSFILPIVQLEQLSGTPLSQRIAVLSQKDQRAARCLTAIGSTLEMALWTGMLVLFYALIPQQVELDWDWLLELGTSDELKWLEHLSNLLYALVLVFWGPIYVACGFTLYLNRRTVLEGWDIELVFRRLRQRISGSAYVLLIGLGLALSTAPTPVWAEQPAVLSCPAPLIDEHEAGPDSPRLLMQPFTSEAARQAINSLLQQPPFKHLQTKSGWRLPERDDAKQQAASQGSGLIPWLNRLVQLGAWIAQGLKVLLWTAVIVLVGIAIWRYKSWIATFVRPAARRGKTLRAQPEQLFGLQVSAQSLPADVAGSAEKLWAAHPRQALSLLYRGLLSRLINDHHLPLKASDTEGQVLQQVAALHQPQLHAFSLSLTHHWQTLAYGHQLPTRDVQQQLCDGWRQLFEAQVQP
jgi:hypothetical protein